MVSVQFAILEDLLTRLEGLHSDVPSLDKAALVLKLKRSLPEAPPEAVALAVETYIARQTTGSKVGAWGSSGFFSLAVLEQASREVIASYRASHFDGLHHVLEVGTGTGSDTAALARVCARVTSIERDPVRAELARRNLAIQGLSNVDLVVGDIMELRRSTDLSLFDGFFADPARRDGTGERVKDSDEYSPPLSEMLTLTNAKVRAIKVSPGLFFDAPSHGWKRQFVGVGDECLEQTLWHGASLDDSSVYIADTATGWSPEAAVCEELAAPSDLRGFICEAHACVNRCQHLGRFFSERGIRQVAPDVMYGISEARPSPSPLLTVFEILDAFPYTPRTLSEAVSALGWTNRTEIKKRNFPEDPERIRSSLKLPAHYHEGQFGTILLFTWHRAPWAILARRSSE